MDITLSFGQNASERIIEWGREYYSSEWANDDTEPSNVDVRKHIEKVMKQELKKKVRRFEGEKAAREIPSLD